MNDASLRPIFYSFRRCPYAIRARLALASAGLAVEIREVSLACKPPELLAASPRGTVPALLPPVASPAAALVAAPRPVTGPAQPLTECLEIMRWALSHHDPQDWLRQGDAEAQALMGELLAACDGPFKHHLDRFKYASRYRAGDGQAQGIAEAAGSGAVEDHGQPDGRGESVGQGGARCQGNRDGGADLKGDIAPENTNPSDTRSGADGETHRLAALVVLRGWNARLAAAEPASGGCGWLLGSRPALADWALLPFVRQFRLVDPATFDAAGDLPALQAWLERFEQGPELAAVLAEPWGPRQPWRSPSWLYHLALPQEWAEAQPLGEYRRSTRGQSLEQVGFIHASYAQQLEATRQRFYADLPQLRLLTIDPQRLAAAGVAVRAEPAPGSGELFPHLYGPLPLSAVVAAESWRPDRALAAVAA